ncbi:MAG TPA: hypothetical protein VK395_34375 [Gemmataceae bacterium]|nr:hypothetical protein [Gemmataceae bacterium]
MPNWLWWILGTLCAFAIARLLVVAWCLIQLRRNWHRVPELWSIDWVDIVYRLKGQFGVTLSATDLECLSADARATLTAGQLWELVAAKIRIAGSEPPTDGWQQVVATLTQALNVKPKRIRPNSRLYADLGMAYGAG